MRILIADDDPTSRSILAGLLRHKGYEVVVVVNGAEALHILRQPNAPQLVVLDWMMPELEGPEVIRQIRNLECECPPYILLLTSRGEKASIIEGLDSGANDYITKPFDAGELRARIEVGQRMVEMQIALIASREAFAHQATHDTLTGILNRAAIISKLNDELARVERNGDELAVGMLDIDHFKQVNDTYGHQTGDESLCAFTRVVCDCLRSYDAMGRIGGEEFLILIPVEPGANPTAPFDRIRKQVANSKITTRSIELSMTVSIGVVCAKGKCFSDLVLAAADAALYRAKHEGRNRACYSEIASFEPLGMGILTSEGS
jgi:diguanylate cyclase (GGDEF)-like protein